MGIDLVLIVQVGFGESRRMEAVFVRWEWVGVKWKVRYLYAEL